jgi:putative ABC transport system permease protein
VVRFELWLPGARYDSLTTVASFYQTLEDQISALPGVEAVGSAFGAPLTAGNVTGELRFDGEPDPEPGEALYASVRPVTPGYFDAMRLQLRRGRGIEATDRAGTTPAAVVNEAFVRQNWGGQDPIGERFRVTADLGFGSPTWTAVGVVGDERGNLRGQANPEVYVPHAQYGPAWSMTVHVRGRSGARDLLDRARGVVHALDPNLPLRSPESVYDAIQRDAAPTRFFLFLVSLSAGLAVLLAAVGIYGVASYLVSRRTREIGIRLALGAERHTVIAVVLRHALWPALIGVAGGLVASIAVTRVMRGLLFEVEPTDPLVLGGVSVLLLLIAAGAGLVPARRAARVDPIEVLRSE